MRQILPTAATSAEHVWSAWFGDFKRKGGTARSGRTLGARTHRCRCRRRHRRAAFIADRTNRKPTTTATRLGSVDFTARGTYINILMLQVNFNTFMMNGLILLMIKSWIKGYTIPFLSKPYQTEIPK